MKNFNEFVQYQDINHNIDLLLENFDVYDLLLDCAEKETTEEQLLNELVGGISALGQSMGQSTANYFKNAASRLGGGLSNLAQKTGMQNVYNKYKQGEQRSKIQQTSKRVSDLQNDLKGLGFTDQKVQNFLTNVNNVLQSGLGKNLNFRGQTYNPSQINSMANPNGNYTTTSPNAPSFNMLASGLRNAVKQGRMQQTGSGEGI